MHLLCVARENLVASSFQKEHGFQQAALPRAIGDTRVMLRTFRRFVNDESGATAIEYGLIAAGISLVIIAVVNGLGTRLNTKFTSISTQLK